MLLFRTLFWELDLRGLSGYGDHQQPEETLTVSLFKLRTDARNWASCQSLAQTAWLASAKDPRSRLDLEYEDTCHLAFGRRVLDPLVYFALLERCRKRRGEMKKDDSDEYRCTPLFDRFMRFEFSDSRGR